MGKLQQILSERGITHYELSQATGFSERAVGKLAFSLENANKRALDVIAKALNIAASQLVEQDESLEETLEGFRQLLDVHYRNFTSTKFDLVTAATRGRSYAIEYVGQITIKPGCIILFYTDERVVTHERFESQYGFSYERLTSEFELIFDCGFEFENGEERWSLFQLKPLISFNTSVELDSLSNVFSSVRASYFEYVSNKKSHSLDQIHSIEFSPLHKNAGVQILNYFQDTLTQKYPNENVTVRLSQHGTTVTMEIESEDGHKEKFEKAFEDYGLVITGQKGVEEYLDNPADQLAMKFQLQQAHNQLETTREILKMKDQLIEQQNLILDSKEARICYFEQEFSKSLSVGRSQTDKILDLAAKAMADDQAVKKLVATFEAELATGNKDKVQQDLKALEAKRPGMLKSIYNWCTKVAGKAGEKAATQEFQDLIETFTDGSATPPT